MTTTKYYAVLCEGVRGSAWLEKGSTSITDKEMREAIIVGYMPLFSKKKDAIAWMVARGSLGRVVVVDVKILS